MQMKRNLIVISAITCMLLLGCGKKESNENLKDQTLPAAPPENSLLYQIKEESKADPNNPDILYHLADLHERNSEWREEIDTLKRVITLNPKMGAAYCKLGSAHLRIEEIAEAVSAFEKCTQTMPQYPVAYNNLGIAYGKLGKVEKEIEAMKKAIKLRPNYATARYNLGLAYLRVHDKTSALAQHDALAEFDITMAEKLLGEINKGAEIK